MSDIQQNIIICSYLVKKEDSSAKVVLEIRAIKCLFFVPFVMFNVDFKWHNNY